MSFVTCSCGEGSCGEALRTSAWEAYYIWLTGRPVSLRYVSTRVLWTPFLYHSIEIEEVGNLRRRLIDRCIPRDTIYPTKSFPKFLCIKWSIFFLVCVDKVSCTGRHTGLREQGLESKTFCFHLLYFSETPEFLVTGKFHNKQHSMSFIFVLVFQQICWMECVHCNTVSLLSLPWLIRCISGENLRLDGSTVNDSHAEVIARRSLVRFFHYHLAILLSGKTDVKSIFVQKERQGKIQLRDGVKFHLYISTAPCGDAALFVHETTTRSV